MEKNDRETMISKLLDCDTFIIASENGIGMVGSSPKLLALYTTITTNLLDLHYVDKDIVQKAYDMAFMSKDELNTFFEKELDTFFKKELNDLLENLKKEINKKETNE